MSEHMMPVHFWVNGEAVNKPIPVRQHLVDFLREDLGLTGSHLGCEHGVCGACQVLVDGVLVRGCLSLAVSANGKTVQTIEGLSERAEFQQLQKAFLTHNAFQCGFCSSGMLLSAYSIVQDYPKATRTDIRELISGNYCRCTGYQSIVDAIEEVLIQNALHAPNPVDPS